MWLNVPRHYSKRTSESRHWHRHAVFRTVLVFALKLIRMFYPVPERAEGLAEDRARFLQRLPLCQLCGTRRCYGRAGLQSEFWSPASLSSLKLPWSAVSTTEIDDKKGCPNSAAASGSKLGDQACSWQKCSREAVSSRPEWLGEPAQGSAGNGGLWTAIRSKGTSSYAEATDDSVTPKATAANRDE